MAPLIPDGIYRIRNAEFILYITCFDGQIVACKYNGSANLKWRIINHGDNRVTIENVAIPGCCLGADGLLGASLVGSDEECTIWTIVKAGSSKYYIQSPDGNYVLGIVGGYGACEKIELVPHTGKDSAKWLFQPIAH